MTANYFMVTRDGLGLDNAGYQPFARGSGPSVSNVTDNVANPTAVRKNLQPNPSFETNTNDWFAASGSPALARVTSPAGQSGSACLSVTATTTNMGVGASGGTSGIDVSPSTDYTASAYARAATTTRSAQFVIDWYDSSGAFVGSATGTAVADSTSSWTRISATGTSPAGAAFARARVMFPTVAVGEVHYVDAVLFEKAATLGSYFEGTAPLYDIPPTITGVPADLSGYQWLFKSKGNVVQPRDIIAPTGFCQSVFRVVRDPAIVSDDSGNTLGTQIYNHGWLLGETLTTYLSEQNGYGGLTIPWPGDGGYKVLPVTGTPVVNDGAGTYGMQTVTWPGGVGTLRQVVTGDGGSTRQVAAILDLLAATTSTQRDTIESTLASTKAAVDAARLNLLNAADAASETVRRQFYARAELAWYLACQATSAPRGPGLEVALLHAMQAVVAKEAGLIGATFTTANYETMTQPIDAVLAMPSGY